MSDDLPTEHDNDRKSGTNRQKDGSIGIYYLSIQ